MLAQLPHSKFARPLAALALTLGLALALGLFAGAASKPVSADASQWQRPQSSWNQSSGWDRQWNNSRSHHRNQFDDGSQIIIGGGSGVIITRPAFVIGNPGFIVNQPPFIVNQGHFIIGQPRFVVRHPNFIFERPSFAKKQWQFIKRHPSLRVGKPWWHKNWSHKRWKHKKHQMHNGMN